MADETMLERAIAIIPGMGGDKPKKRAAAKKVDHNKALADVKKNIEKLKKDLERLAGLVAKHVAGLGKKAAPAKKAAKPAARKKPAAKKRPAPRKRAAKAKTTRK